MDDFEKLMCIAQLTKNWNSLVPTSTINKLFCRILLELGQLLSDR